MVRPSNPATVEDSLHVEGDLRPFEIRKLIDHWSKLDHRLRSFPAGTVRLELHVKDREKPGQQVLLEAHIEGRSPIVATSSDGDIDHALNVVRDEMIRQITDAKNRTEPRHNKHLRNNH